MSEVEKMYENAGVKPYYDYTVLKEGYDGKITFTKQAVRGKAQLFKNKKLRIIQVLPFYPDFTAEKQLELIKKLGNINIDIDNGCYMSSEILEVEAHCDTFEETLAEFVNNLWQDLTESEQEQIRSILNG